MTGIGFSLLIATVGAILRFAVNGPANQNGFNIHTGGMILMIVGAIGVVFSMLFWSSFAPFGRSRSVSRREEIVSQNGHEQGRSVRVTRDDVVR